MNTINPLVERMRRISWRERAEVTPEARALIERHVELIRPVVRHIMAKTGKPVSEAHGIALTPAHNSPEYRSLHDTLSEEMDLTDAVVSWPLVMTIVASEVWHLDSELSQLPNPWAPLVKLYELGYPASHLDAPDMSSVHLTVFLRDGEENFPVC